MKVLSIDVGIKNLSFCLFHIEEKTNHLNIVKWDNIDLTESSNKQCIEVDKNGLCNKPAKFMKDNKCYCLKHSKKQDFLHPSTELKQSFINKQKIHSLIEIAEKYKIKYENPPKKTILTNLLNQYAINNCFTSIEKVGASKIDLVTIGRNIQQKFDEILEDHLSTISCIIIENQIGPIANKMKTIQGMLSQYFIMRNNNIKIEFISASNKLKDFLPVEKLDYKQRKQLGIKTCMELICSDFRFKEWEDVFKKHNKKDDLSDCFLQGMWYIKNKL
jgi:hypothetical protein